MENEFSPVSCLPGNDFDRDKGDASGAGGMNTIKSCCLIENSSVSASEIEAESLYVWHR